MTWLLSTDVEHVRKPVSKALKVVTAIHPTEEDNNPLDSMGEEVPGPATETTLTGTTNIVTAANSKDTDKRNAVRESRRTNPAETLKAKPTGPEFN